MVSRNFHVPITALYILLFTITCAWPESMPIACRTALNNPGDNTRDPGNITPGDSKKNLSNKIDTSFGGIPLYFTPNMGQVDVRAQFYARTPGYTLCVTKTGLVFSGKTGNLESVPNNLLDPGKGHISSPEPGKPITGKFQQDVSRLVFLGANPDPEIIPVDVSGHKVNYFIGNDRSRWKTGITTSLAVLYKDLYPQVDLKIYGINRKIEYDFLVKPGGDVSSIQFKYENVKDVQVDENGNIVIKTTFTEIVHRAPRGYQLINQQVSPVKTRFNKLGKNVFGFRIEDYDRDYALVIDPVIDLTYSTYLGGEDRISVCYDMALDSSGNIYVVGYTNTLLFPTINSFQSTIASEQDAFVSKLDPTGTTLVYSTYLGGNQVDTAYGISVSDSGMAYVTGMTVSEDFPTLIAMQKSLSFANRSDMFITRIDSSGSITFSSYLGGYFEDYGYGIDVIPSGMFHDVYITGGTYSLNFPTLAAYQPTNNGTGDVFVSMLRSNPIGGIMMIYSTYLGGSGSEQGYAISVTAGGNASITGYTNSTDFPTVNAYQASYQGGQDSFVTTLNSTGTSLVYSTYLGGADDEFGNDIAVDDSGYSYVTGHTKSFNFPTLKSIQPALNGPMADVFVSKFNVSGNLMLSTFLGGSGSDSGYGIDVIPVGFSKDVFLVGLTTSSDFPTANAYQPGSASMDYDVFVSRIRIDISNNPAMVYSTYLGGSIFNMGQSIEVQSSGNVYIAGSTASEDFPTVSPHQEVKNGMMDVFVSKLDNTGSTLIYSTYIGGGGARQMGQDVEVDNSGNIYVVGWTDCLGFPTLNAYQPKMSLVPETSHEPEIFVTKINPAGSLSYSTFLGGQGLDIGRGIDVDGTGNVYITGLTQSMDFPTVKAIQKDIGSSLQDVFVSRLDTSGVLTFSTYLGGTAADVGYGITVKPSGFNMDMYITGTTSSTDFPIVNPVQVVNKGLYDVFVSRLRIDEFDVTYLNFSTYLGGTGLDIGVAIKVDNSNSVYVTGVTYGPDFPLKNPWQGIFGGVKDGFLTIIDTLGSALVYSTFFGGSGNDMGRNIGLDNNGIVHVVGETDSADFPTMNSIQPTVSGGIDIFLARFNTVGSVIYSTYLGGSNNDSAVDITVVSKGTDSHVALTGYTNSMDFPTMNAFQPTYGGGINDACILKTRFDALGNGYLDYSTFLGGIAMDAGFGIVTDYSGNIIVTGYTQSPDFTTKNAYQEKLLGDIDVFTAKFSAPPPVIPVFNNYLILSLIVFVSITFLLFMGKTIRS